MSWNIRKVGTRAAVIASVLAEPYVPADVKARIVDKVSAIELPEKNVVLVESEGHFDDASPRSQWKTDREVTRVIVTPLLDTEPTPA